MPLVILAGAIPPDSPLAAGVVAPVCRAPTALELTLVVGVRRLISLLGLEHRSGH